MSRAASPLRGSIHRALLGAVLVFAAVSTGAAQGGPDRAPAADAAVAHSSKPAAGGVLGLLPPNSTTDHAIEAGGRTLAYTATAGTFTLFNGSGERSAAIFYTAYALKGADEKRPVTFVFNGGPGAASAYLHLGLVGPRVVAFGPDHDGAGAQLHNNPDTWLAFTDLVLIDPVGTGWSRAAKPDDASNFWNVRQDAASLAKVIALYLLQNNRAAAPKFLLGESYGGFRAVKTARALQNDQGIVVDAIVMVSPFLDGGFQFGAQRSALGAALRLPSLAAARLDRENTFTPEALDAAERFAITDYLVTLAGAPPTGEAAARFYARVAELTGVPEAVVAAGRGFIGDRYAKHVRGERGAIASPYDAAFTAADPFPEAASDEGSDPILDGFLQALGGQFAAYARSELGFATEMTFTLLNRDISRKWDWGGGGRVQASAMRDLREYLALNPNARVWAAHGRSDLVTPYGTTRYLLEHLPLRLAPRAQLKVYKGGHMFYFGPAVRDEMAADARVFYAGTR